jgi:hypothetical protein
MKVFLLFHISHLDRHGLIEHRDRWGELLIEPELGDDVKILGCYSTVELAEARIERARNIPGFWNEPECFLISHYEMDADRWADGFVVGDDDNVSQ